MKPLLIAAGAGDCGDRIDPAQDLDQPGELDAPIVAGPPKGFVKGRVHA
jgi:hypothetical protein